MNALPPDHPRPLVRGMPPRHDQTGDGGDCLEDGVRGISRVMRPDICHPPESSEGDVRAAEQWLPMIYEDLRRLAAQKMARESPGQTLQPTALVHEAWLRLAVSERQRWTSRGHFFGAAAEAMRRVLIDRARRKNRARHGRGLARVNLEDLDLAVTASDEALLRVNDALEKLTAEDQVKADLVKLRFFTGLSIAAA